VALNSAYRMESTVSELLGFARPTMMQFKTASVNRVIDESVAFVKLRADKAKVAIEINREQSLPELALDVVHLREALVNVILNAIQAMENRNFSLPPKANLNHDESRISISTKKTRLGKHCGTSCTWNWRSRQLINRRTFRRSYSRRGLSACR